MALTALRLIEVDNQEVNVVEFRSFDQLRDYVKGKKGLVKKPGTPTYEAAPDEGKKLVKNKLKEAVQAKKKSQSD